MGQKSHGLRNDFPVVMFITTEKTTGAATMCGVTREKIDRDHLMKWGFRGPKVGESFSGFIWLST